MKNLLLIIVSSVSLNFCFGQTELLINKNPHRSIRRYEIPKPVLAQNRLYSGLHEQVDSAWTRQYGGDGIGNVTSSKAYFTYSHEHLLASESYLDFYLESGEQYNGRQEEYFYNEMGQCTLHYTNEQDLSTLYWLRKDREELGWNEQTNSFEYRRSAWNNDLSEFEYIFKNVVSFTSSNQPDESLSYSWDGDRWKTTGRDDYDYNDADSIKTINTYNWNEGAEEWELEYKEEYYYTNNVILDSILDYWDIGFGLEFNSKDILIYNEQGLQEFNLYYEWNGSNWDPIVKDEYKYTPEGKETLWTYYEWDADEERFVENYYEENIYTAAGDVKKYTVADYDLDAEAWEPFWIVEKFYDENVDGSTIIWPNPAFYEPVSFHHKPVFDLLTVLFDNNEWGWGDSVIYFYGNIISATIPVSELNVNVYPNPTSDQMTIQMEELGPSATITFFDQQGKFAATRPLQSNVPVSISGLIPGTYVYRIRNGIEFYSGKIVKE